MSIEAEALALFGVLPPCGCLTPDPGAYWTVTHVDLSHHSFSYQGENLGVTVTVEMCCGQCCRIQTLKFRMRGENLLERVKLLQRQIYPVEMIVYG